MTWLLLYLETMEVDSNNNGGSECQMVVEVKQT